MDGTCLSSAYCTCVLFEVINIWGKYSVYSSYIGKVFFVDRLGANC